MKNKEYFSAIVAFIWIMLTACVSERKTTNSYPEFEGLITEKTVESFILQNQNNIPKKITLNSLGGEPIAAMRMGLWIYRNKISVEVKAVCLSSCANYLFVAGSKKTIIPPGIVGWHGGAEQKNFRERDSYFDNILKKIDGKKSINKEEEITISNPEKFADYQYSKKSRPLQKDFYAEIGVDEYLTRLGQEPFNYKKIWTLERQTMEKFGVCKVDTPADYASESYLNRAEKLFGHKVIKIESTASRRDYE